jgi:hypothetical protein
MVTVFMRGGLGNQMFQYAAGLNLAKKNKTDLMLDTVHILDRFPRPHFTYRTFDLAEVFMIEPRFTHLSKFAEKMPIPGFWLGIDLMAMNLRQAFGYTKILYQDERKDFDLLSFPEKKNVVLYGRWENERYFIENESAVRESLKFRHPLEGEAATLAEDIRMANSVALHVRRGDYAAVKTVTKLMGDIDLSYYKNAVAYMSKKIASPQFFIFSDDIEWCKENIKLDVPAIYIPASSSGPKAAFHLQMMSLCKHNIIANSTFSWWGAWLNANPEKTVIAPKTWLAGASKEIIPSSWITL